MDGPVTADMMKSQADEYASAHASMDANEGDSAQLASLQQQLQQVESQLAGMQ